MTTHRARAPEDEVTVIFNISGEIDDGPGTATLAAEHIGQDPILCCRWNCTPQNSGLDRKLARIHGQECSGSGWIQKDLI